MKDKMKKVAFWTTVLLVPGGSLLLLYKLQQEKHRVKEVVQDLEKMAARIKNEAWHNQDAKKKIVEGIKLAVKRIEYKFNGGKEDESK